MDAEVATDMMRDTEIIKEVTSDTSLHWGKAEKAGAVYPGEEKAWRISSLCINTWRESVNEMVSSDKARGRGHKQNRNFCLDIRKLFSVVRVTKHWDGLKSEVVNLHPWNNQKLSEHSSGQPALGDSAGSGAWADGFQGPFQSQWFCDSVIL